MQQAEFPHGARIYHRVRKQHGNVVVHDKLWTDPSSICVQFDGSPDIVEVTKKLLDVCSGDLKYQPGDKVRIANKPSLTEYAGQTATIIRPYMLYSTGQSYVLEFSNGDEEIIHEGHFEKEVSDA